VTRGPSLIDRAISLVAQRLNQHLRGRFGVADDLVAVTALTDAEGKPAVAARNRLAVFVTNIAHDPTARGAGPRPAGIAGRLPVGQAPIHLNIHMMLASNFDPDNYLESLKILSHAVQFFQANPVFDRLNAPEMDASLQQLALEIANLGVDAASQLWGTLGGRYVPSVQYRVRTIAIDAGAMIAEELAITGAESRAAPERVAPERAAERVAP
jgi:Pvc16 N-terminal domain